MGKAESVGSAESETLAGLQARLREEKDELDDLGCNSIEIIFGPESGP